MRSEYIVQYADEEGTSTEFLLADDLASWRPAVEASGPAPQADAATIEAASPRSVESQPERGSQPSPQISWGGSFASPIHRGGEDPSKSLKRPADDEVAVRTSHVFPPPRMARELMGGG